MENLLRKVLTFMLLIKLVISQDDKYCPSPRFRCNTGICVDNSFLCPAALTCPGLKKVNQFTCTLNDFLLEEKTNCPKVTCWDSTCSDDSDKCPTMVSCPANNSVRCPDNSCVESPSDCSKYVDCPTFIPVRCPNGDCRKEIKDCPSRVTCPAAFSVLCNDGSCRMTSDQCEIPAIQTQCGDQTMTRCPDGTCTSSKFLCSTPRTCPVGYVLCWNGACAENLSLCDAPALGQSDTCRNKDLVRCAFDGSCRFNINDCPTGTICPVDRPVKCWDNSCKETITKCPAYQGCPEGTSKCQDGSCSSKGCGSHVTCSMDAAFKCYDNTCRRNAQDCPPRIDCPNKFPILCWDGTCVANRADCSQPDICSSTEPVKCPDNMCKKTVEECKALSDCPTGLLRCADGSCRRKTADCPNSSCPLNSPFKCPNGLCISNPNNCENENGCPFYAAIKCDDGSCTKTKDGCKNIKVDCNAPDTQLCQDGSCIPLTELCPTSNGCPRNLPLKCADGKCIDPTKTTCAIPSCPAESPIKCLNGLCAVSSSNCSSAYTMTAASGLCQGLIVCADGICAVNPEECKPVYKCQVGEVRCNDGSCRNAQEFCPLANTCPAEKYTRCADGTCATDIGSCLNVSGCPETTPYKCTNSGLCVGNTSQCATYEAQFTQANGCNRSNPVKCPTGKCVNDLSQCDENACPDGYFPCNTGQCVTDLRECSDDPDEDVGCKEGLVACPDGTCKDKFENCLNTEKCPLKTPFRCLNGNCKKYPFKSIETSSLDYCSIGIRCPDYKPYLCADGSCEEKSSFCLSLLSCPDTSPKRCFDRTCVDDTNKCTESNNKCPAKNPILCSTSGNCVSNIFDCHNLYCPPATPYKCYTGKCETSPRNCVINLFAKASICGPLEFSCLDGSCRTSQESCPIYAGCTDTKSPYKCKDGSCAESQSSCPDDVAFKCDEGANLCEDGICRTTCSEYNGCTNDKPLLCPTGQCVSTLSECAGISNCPVDTPFKCIDGTCALYVEYCKRPKRGFIGTDIKLYSYSGVDLEANIIISDKNNILGSIKIPSNSFYWSNKVITDDTNTNSTSSNSTQPDSDVVSKSSDAVISIKSIPSSRLRNTASVYHETRQEDVDSIFPYADAGNNYTLEYEYTVLSPVLEVKLESSQTYFNNFVILMLAYDFPTNSTEFNALKDVCLAKLNANNLWVCTQNEFFISANVDYQLYGGINTPGIYSVIFSPLPNNSVLEIEQNNIIKYFIIILIASVVSAVVVFIGVYIFWRIYRYRGKYKESREENKKFEKKMLEMTFIGTNHLGQTLGDNLDNIIYTSNPSFRMVKEESNNQRLEELQNLQESMLRRYRQYEKVNDQLKGKYDLLQVELNRMKEYKAKLNRAESEPEQNIYVKSDEE